MNRTEKIEVVYFKLKETKTFSNGNVIFGGQKLIQSSMTDGDLTLYNTVEETDQTNWFWAREDEVEFVEAVMETWTLEELEARRKIIEETWL